MKQKISSRGLQAAVIGLQWGDEGKGKVIDHLISAVCATARHKNPLVVRYQGGANAGHTVYVGDKKHVLHLLPTGVLHEGVYSIIGHGTVVDPLSLADEIAALDFDKKKLLISAQAHLVMPYHKSLDEAREGAAKNNSIGTTKRGIGPAYADKASRIGLRFEDLYKKDFKDRLSRVLAEKNAILHSLYKRSVVDLDQTYEAMMHVSEFLKPFIRNDTGSIIRQSIKQGDPVLFEGAQGVMLDIDQGTYPYVTSSNASSGGIANGTGVPPNKLDELIGIAKAYTTRVGEGPFPSEMGIAESHNLQKLGNEFGATTGRPRRCGWLDMPQMKYAVGVSGATSLILTKLDILAGLGSLKVVTAYDLPVGAVKDPISHWDICKPVYKEFDPIPEFEFEGLEDSKDLPQQAKDYIGYIEHQLGIPVRFVSVGPQRDDVVDWNFDD